MKFEDLPQVKKATFAEQELDKFLLKRGIVPYIPIPGTAHPFDRLCATADKKKLFIAEVKAKASRKYFPDTGMNLKSHNDYIHIRDTYNIDIWLFFVDEFKKQIYGNLLSELEKSIRIDYQGRSLQYPLIQATKSGTEIIYFCLDNMIKVCDIDEITAKQLTELSTRNYDYPEYNFSPTSGGEEWHAKPG